MRKYEVYVNGSASGTIIEADTLGEARVIARKSGYRIFELVDHDQEAFEASMGKPEYDQVIAYITEVKANRSFDLWLTEEHDPMMASAIPTKLPVTAETPEKPSREVISKACQWARTTGVVAYRDFLSSVEWYLR